MRRLRGAQQYIYADLAHSRYICALMLLLAWIELKTTRMRLEPEGNYI